MTDLLKQDRQHRLIKLIIDHYGGPNFFRGKRILDLGCGDGGIALALSRLQAAEIICVDARDAHIRSIQKKYPHLQTVCADLDVAWPFKDQMFDLVLSIDLFSHLENQDKHLSDITSVSENIILETEALNSTDLDLRFLVEEPAILPDNSFHGRGIVISSRAIENKLSHLNSKFKRIAETKLNSQGFNYDWSERGAGPVRQPSNRRLWFIRSDKFLARKIRSHQDLKLAQELAKRPHSSLKSMALCLYGDFPIDKIVELKHLHARYDLFVHTFDPERGKEIQTLLSPLAISTAQVDATDPLAREAFALQQTNDLKNRREQACYSIYDQVVFKRAVFPFELNPPFFKEHKAKLLPEEGVVANSFVGDMIAVLYDYLDDYRGGENLSFQDLLKKHLEEFSIPLL